MRTKNRIFCIIIALVMAVCCAALSACSDKSDGKPKQPTPTFSLDKTHIELTVGDSLEMLTLTVANVNDTIEWASSNKDVAAVTVGSSANRASVRPVGKGYATISAVAGEYIAVCTVKVNAEVSLELLTPSLNLFSGRAATIEVETDAQSLTYTSNNPSVATVNSNGLVSAISGGTARITVSAGSKSVVCEVIVTEAYVHLDKNELFLTREEGSNTYQLTAESNGNVTWRSLDDEVATVENGLVTAVAKGETSIIASYVNAEAVCVVKVKDEILTVTLSESAHRLEGGKSFKLSATVSPEQTGNDARVTWGVISGANLVTVDEDGTVTANNNEEYGTAVVRATSVKDPDAHAECEVTVPDPYGDWIAISDAASLRAALASGNESKSMYLTTDIDLGGETLNSSLGNYNGTFDGRGFSITNLTCGSLFGGIGNNGVVKQLSITANAANIGGNMGIFGQEMSGKVQDCILDLTFGTTEYAASIARNSKGEISNVILLLKNPSNTRNVYAGCSQSGGKWNDVYYAVYEGALTAGGPTLKTDEQLKEASLYTSFSDEVWIIEDGELPELVNANKHTGIKVSLNVEQTEVYVGENVALVATVKPIGLSAAEKAVVWESSDESIFTVTDGVIHGVKAGTATVTVKSALDPEKTATCTVTVKAIEISIDTVVTELKTNGQKQLTATVNRGGYKWESSDSGVATVNADGLVTAVGEGTVTITVQSLLDPTVTDTVTIEVKDNIEISVVLSSTTLALDRDDTATLSATVVNSEGGVQWSSSDDTVASVDENGNITTYGVDGTAVITATANEADGDGNYAEASCTVTVTLVPITVTPSGETELEITLGSTINVSELATASKGGLAASITDGEDFVSIDDGVITAVADGTATIRISSDISYSDYAAAYIEIEITVFTPAVELKMSSRYSTGLTSTTLQLILTPMPESAAAGDIVWTSSDESVISSIIGGATADAYTAMFTPKKYGFATITASYAFGGRTYTASCEVEVFNPNGATAVSTVAGLKTALSTTNGKFYLACDIDFGETVYTSSFAGTVVSVTVDGRGYALKNIKTNFSANDIGFINMLDGLTTLKNIAFIDFDINGTSTFMYGGLIGSITANGCLSNCYFEGVISARRANELYVGTVGTIHTPTSNIENCVFNVSFGDGALDGANANANPKVIAGRWFNGTITAVVNSTAIGGGKILVAPLNGQDKLAHALKTEEAMKMSSTYDSSWSAWVIEDGELPRIRTGWDD